MKKVNDVKPGDKVIYKSGSKVIVATVVEKPIDDRARPSFVVGRVDLDNGDYLTRTSYTYESVDECKAVIIQELMDGLDEAKKLRDFHAARAKKIEKALKQFQDEDKKWAESE